MIEAIRINRNHFVVKSIDPLNGKVIQSATVYNEGDAIKFAYFCNRTYIVDKMVGWLHQRIKALQIGSCDRQRIQAENFLIMIQLASKTSLHNIMELIVRNEPMIRFIAPGEKSRQFPYYQNVILDILFFCQEMKGAKS